MKADTPGLSPDKLLQHWLGHMRLTRRVIDAFPEDKLFTFSMGGMRPFGTMMLEVIGMAVSLVEGIIAGSWDADTNYEARPKANVLQRWDETIETITTRWPDIPPERFQQTLMAQQWEMPVYDAIFYAIDNEIHHRAQGYVYLRALGIEPPFFHER